MYTIGVLTSNKATEIRRMYGSEYTGSGICLRGRNNGYIHSSIQVVFRIPHIYQKVQVEMEQEGSLESIGAGVTGSKL